MNPVNEVYCLGDTCWRGPTQLYAQLIKAQGILVYKSNEHEINWCFIAYAEC